MRSDLQAALSKVHAATVDVHGRAIRLHTKIKAYSQLDQKRNGKVAGTPK
jgi:hypothetical protein